MNYVAQINYEYQITQIGLPAARQALLINPKNPATLILLGRAYSMVGNPSLGVKLISDALQISPKNLNALYYLGIINISLGNLNEARAFLQQAISLSEDPSQIEQIQILIDTYLP